MAQIMACRLFGIKQLSEPMLVKIDRLSTKYMYCGFHKLPSLIQYFLDKLIK